jgi:hypothetical protein
MLSVQSLAALYGEWTWSPVYEVWMWFLDIEIWQTFEDMTQLWVGF